MNQPEWAWSLEVTIPSSIEIGRAQIEKLLEAMTSLGWGGREYFHVQMAAEEAMVNAVTHGNQLSEDKVIEVEFHVSETQVYLRFKDQGNGFCPEDVPDPRASDRLDCTNGRGVLLIKEMMSKVTYNQCGNEVTMIKHRDATKK